MQKIINRLRTLGVRVHAIYLEVDELEDEKKLLQLEDLLLLARFSLTEPNLELYNETLKLFAQYARKLAVTCRKVYGESIRGKLRRLAEAVGGLTLTRKQFNSLEPLPPVWKNRRPFVYFASFYQGLKRAIIEMEDYKADETGLPTPKMQEMLDSFLLEMEEYRLLFEDKWADGLINDKWQLTRDITIHINALHANLWNLLDAIPDCAYKCKVYRAVEVIDEFNDDISGYYIG